MQLRTSGMEHVPTCLVGSGLVRHSLLPDLLEPALAHHGLEPGLASLWASLDHLRVALGPDPDQRGLDPGIYWRLQLGIRRGLYQRVLHHPQSFPCLVGRCHPPPCRCFRLDQIQNSFCEKCYTTINYLICCGPFLVELSQELSPTKQYEQDQ